MNGIYRLVILPEFSSYSHVNLNQSQRHEKYDNNSRCAIMFFLTG
jgi:hypothetical protein